MGGNPLRNSDPRGLCPMCLIPALPYVGEAAVVAAAWWASQNTFQDETPNRGKPWDWHTNPGSGQERLYGLMAGRPSTLTGITITGKDDPTLITGAPTGERFPKWILAVAKRPDQSRSVQPVEEKYGIHCRINHEHGQRPAI